MEPFTDNVLLKSFSRKAEGAFSYLWYGQRFTDLPSYHPTKHYREWTCFGPITKDDPFPVPAWRLERAS